MTPSHAEPESIDMTDGRRTRRVRNRVAVIDAYLDLVGEGNDSPSVAEVAERSQVSHRSVFRYFSDKDELARSSIDRQIARLGPLLTLDSDPAAPLADRIDLLLTRRFELYEQIGPIARLMRSIATRENSMGELLSKNRHLARRQVAQLFEPELSAMDPDGSEEVLALIDVLCSFESSELFRHDLDLPMDRSITSIARAIDALLAQPARSLR